MRTHLVTKFVCSKCKSLLELSYGKNHAPHSRGEPTGADMVENTISVDPRKTCLAPGRRLAEAMNEVISKSKL